jgi:hypothetical protein
MTHTVQELALVIAVKNHDPLMVGEAFLKQTGIIPSEWELAQKPYLSQQATQLVFTNGLSIIAELERVIFSQPLDLSENLRTRLSMGFDRHPPRNVFFVFHRFVWI